ncbi:hypothetical protein AS4_28810 [Acinetobacter guillouiae]|uniref:hypothetical protein n=1 Tax=Acinetobacter guillouiae TaxID=106649 RepID=UPI0004EF6855|nr:hypothetical protein [Acinetobacter guillouiae]BAP37821.1 hypothetical protein AS4_28810 [Acinetobacter guillouiae]
MNIKEKLEQARALYLDKYPYSPNIIFIGRDLIEDLSLMIGGYDFYEKTHTHLWGCDVIRVLSGDTLKFAEHSDVRKAIVKFNLDKSCSSYPVPKTHTTVGGRSNGNLIPSKVIELEPIEFTKEEVEIYLMQN